MEKKKGQEIEPMYKDAKMSMLHELRNHMAGMMGDDLKNAKGMGKVEVAGDSPDALAAGLDKAKGMLGQDGSDEEGSEHEASESEPEEESEEGTEDAVKMIGDLVDHETAEGEMTPDDIDSLIQMLEQKKQTMGHGMSAEHSDEQVGE